MFTKKGAIAAVAAMALTIGIAGASRADGYATAGGVMAGSNPLTSIKVTACNMNHVTSGMVAIVNQQAYFQAGVSVALFASSSATSTTSQPSVVITTAPGFFAVGSRSVPAYAIVSVTGSGAGSVSFQVMDEHNNVLWTSNGAHLFTIGSTFLYTW